MGLLSTLKDLFTTTEEPARLDDALNPFAKAEAQAIDINPSCSLVRQVGRLRNLLAVKKPTSEIEAQIATYQNSIYSATGNLLTTEAEAIAYFETLGR